MYDPQEMIECLGEVQDGWCTQCHEKCPGVADGGECPWSHTPEECQRIREFADFLSAYRAEVMDAKPAQVLPRYRVFGVNPTPGAQASQSLINAYPTHWAAIQVAVDHPQANSVIDWDTKEVIWYRLPSDANG